jgi:hypothetical protein
MSVPDKHLFDEKVYLAANPDVAELVASGKVSSAQAHYDLHGQREGRIATAQEFVREHDRTLSECREALAARDRRIADLAQEMAERDASLQAANPPLWMRYRRAAGRAVGKLPPPAALLVRRSAKLAWWTVSLQLPTKVRQWRARLRPVQQQSGGPHFAPPSDDFCLAVPFGYPIEKPQSAPSVAVVCHMYYPEMLEEFKRYFCNIGFHFDLFLTTDTEEKKQVIEQGLAGWTRGAVEVRLAPNRGRDIAPKLITCQDVYDKYEFFLHVHTKRSPQLDILSGWRTYLLETLLGSPEIVQSVFEAFAADPKLGMVAPEHFGGVRGSIGWGWNFEVARDFAKGLGLSLSLDGRIDFPSGSMFWGRSSALAPLLKRSLTVEDFPPEDKQLDATLGHVIERLYFFVCEKAGYRWTKIIRPELSKRTERILHAESRADVRESVVAHQYGLLSRTPSGEQGFLRSLAPALSPERRIYERSDLRDLEFGAFCEELRKHVAGEDSRIDFDEEFYLRANPDVARDVQERRLSCGYAHYCIAGRAEGRKHSDKALHRRYGIHPTLGTGFLAPVDRSPLQDVALLSGMPESPRSLLLILFSHLQEDLFFAGYSEFFRDYGPIFARFERVVIAVEHREFDASLAARYAPNIEVMHMSAVGSIGYKPALLVAFNAELTERAHRMLPQHRDRIVYYCQDFESGFHPFGVDYIIGERAVARTPNLVVSTEILRRFFQQNGLLADQNVFVTRPRIEALEVSPQKTKRLFLYYRPEMFHKRNLPEVLKEVVLRFTEKYTGYEIYMVGSVRTSYSYRANGTQVYVISKLPMKEYVELISSCDVVVSLIYAAHPGVIAYQAAASGIPTVTNTFRNRDAALLRSISQNLVPYDPVHGDLLESIETALAMPKGGRSFNENLYSGEGGASLLEFHSGILQQTGQARVAEPA